jgi:RND family efflux transporter MFP subunit
MKASFPILCAAMAALFSGCGGNRPPGGDNEAGLPAVAVRVAVVRAEDLILPAESMGTVRPLRSAQLAAKVMGSIVEMPVVLGQRVRAGDLLVRLHADEISARVAQARAQLDAAGRDLDRERELLAKGASTRETVRSLGDRFAAASAMVREAEAMEGYTRLLAPFDGTIAGKFADVGDLASPGLPLVAIEDSDRFEVEAPLPGSLAARLGPGAKLRVTVPSRGLAFTGALAELSPAADQAAHTVLAKVRVPDGIPVRSGEFARVEADGESVAALMAPTTAVATTGQMQQVFVVGPDNRAVLRLVRTGAARGDRVEILSGLDDGERVVVGPPVGLREGRVLEVLP